MILGLGCFLVFTAWQTSANVETTTVSIFFSNRCNPNSSVGISYGDSLGFYSLCINYAVNSVFTLTGPPLIAIFGEKISIFVSSAIYCSIIAALIRPFVATIFAGSALSGIGGVMWTTQGFILLKNSHEDSIDRNTAVFWVMLQASFVVGNLFYFLFILLHNENDPTKTICISSETNAIIYSILLAIGLMGAVTFLFLRSDKKTKVSSADPEKEPLVKPLKSSSLNPSDSLNNSSTMELKPEKETVKQILLNAWQNFLLTIKMMFTKRMLLLNITCCYIGLEWAFWSGIIGTLAARTLQKAEYAGLIGMAVGLGEITSGSLLAIFGKVMDRVGYDTIVLFGYIAHTVTYLLVFYTVPDDATAKLRPTDDSYLIHQFEAQLALLIVAGFLMGVGDCCLNTQSYKILSEAYPEDDKGASAVTNMELFICLMGAVSFLLGGVPSFTLKWQLLLLTLAGAVGTIAFVIAARSVRNQQK